MHIIKLNATESTNDYLRFLYSKGNLQNRTVVVAKSQTKGRGQMGATWSSKSYNNLTFSIFAKGLNLKVEHKFYLSIATSLALLNSLKRQNLRQLHVKWPNDILADNKKIGGILIENILKGRQVAASIIGIGLNVNQQEFQDLPKAISLKNITGVTYDLDFLLSDILKQLDKYLKYITENQFTKLKTEYESSLFRRKKPSTFTDQKGQIFTGYIQGVSEDGKLKLLLEDNLLKSYDLKQVNLLY